MYKYKRLTIVQGILIIIISIALSTLWIDFFENIDVALTITVISSFMIGLLQIAKALEANPY